MILQNSTDVKTEYFMDENKDISPIDVRYEKHTINPNGLIQLQNIPSPLHTVFDVKGRDGITVIKYNKVEVISNKYDFTVDYINGILTFHSSQVGKEIQVSYTNSIGRLSISADRIFTGIDNQGNIAQTLGTLLEEGRQTLSDLEVLGGATKVITEIEGYIESIRELTGNIVEGDNINTKLIKSTDVAKSTNITLNSTINNANNQINEMNSWVETHGDIVNLDNRVDSTEVKLNTVSTQLAEIVYYTIKDDDTLNNAILENNSNIKVLSGEYLSNKDDYALKLIGKQNVAIEGYGKIKCKGNGVLIQNCENVFIRESVFERLTQGRFGESSCGILIDNSTNIFIEKDCCYKFTDGIKVINASTDVFILKNKTKYCAEEGIVFNEDCSGVIEDNTISKHLGDGILIKSVDTVKVKGNKIKDPVDKDLTATLYNEMITNLNPSIPRPIRGGGITTNVEHSLKQARNVLFESNYISDTSYGIGVIGGKNIDILNNTISNTLASSIVINNDTTYNQNQLSTDTVNIKGNKLFGLSSTSQTNLIKIEKTSPMNIKNVIISENVIDCINSTVSHTGIYTNVNCKIHSNIIDNYNYAIFSISDNADIKGNTLNGLSQFSTSKVGIYTKGGAVNDNTLGVNTIINKSQIIFDGATNSTCSGNKVIYNGTEGAIQFINSSKWCSALGNVFTLSGGYSYGGGSINNGTIKVDGYYISPSIPTEQGYKKDDIVMKANADIGDIFGWINQGNETTSNFKVYSQRGYKSIDGIANVTPQYLGEEIFDWRLKKFYKAVGTTSADWKEITN